MYYLLKVFRTPLYKGQLPTLQDFVAACGFGVLAILIGWWLFTRVKDELTYRV
jgi:ABC-type polysaccharide/polyol phosphate export permease